MKLSDAGSSPTTWLLMVRVVCVREKRDSAELGVSRCASAAERCKVAAISLDYCKPAASAVYVDCQSGMLCWIIP